jgi:hypothetical protein
MENTVKITEDELKEMKDLVESGDLDLSELRVKFRQHTGADTTLNDEQLTAAAHTEDDVDELLINNIRDIEQNGLQIV